MDATGLYSADPANGIISHHECVLYEGYLDFRFGVEAVRYEVGRFLNLGKTTPSLIDDIERSSRRRKLGLAFAIIGMVLLIVVKLEIVRGDLLLLSAFAAFILAILTIFRRDREYKLAVNLLQNGFEFLENERVRFIEWNDVIEIFFDVEYSIKPTNNLSIRKVIVDSGRESFINSNLSQYNRLSKAIEDETFNILAAKNWNLYKSGKPVRFGNYIVVKQDELSVDGRVFDLKDIQSMYFEVGKIFIKKKGIILSSVNMNLEVHDVPNVNVLKYILERASR